MQNFRLLTAHVKIREIRTLVGSFYWKYRKFQLKKYRGFMSHGTNEWCKIEEKLWCKIEEKLIFCFKNDKNLVNFDLGTQDSRNSHFDWFLLCKVYNVWPKKVQKSYLSWNWHVMQKLKKNWSVVWKMTRRIWQIFNGALDDLKIGPWWEPLIQSRICMSLKFTVDSCVMTIKNDAKFEKLELTCRFKTDMKNLTNFDPSTKKSQKFSL